MERRSLQLPPHLHLQERHSGLQPAPPGGERPNVWQEAVTLRDQRAGEVPVSGGLHPEARADNSLSRRRPMGHPKDLLHESLQLSEGLHQEAPGQQPVQYQQLQAVGRGGGSPSPSLQRKESKNRKQAEALIAMVTGQNPHCGKARLPCLWRELGKNKEIHEDFAVILFQV